MHYLGEFISIGVAFSWTATALLSEFGSKRLGNLTLNVLRMALALLFSVVLFGVVTGNILPPGASAEACGWMLLSGLVGYVIGDFCLFQCYIIIGSRYGQLFMTLAPLSAALMAWVTLGQQMTLMSILAMLVTLFGISISVLGRGEHHKVSLKLPLNGILFAIGYGDNDLRTIRGGRLLTDGSAIYSSGHRLHPDGDDTDYHYTACILAIPREDHLEGNSWCIDLCDRCQPVLSWYMSKTRI